MSGWSDMPEQPRVCAGCGEKVTLNDFLWFKRFPVMETWHWRCRG
jgi:hypothetical protein